MTTATMLDELVPVSDFADILDRPWSPLHMTVVEFERGTWKNPGAREQAIREVFGISPTWYYSLLTRVLDHPQAAVYDPVTVARLHRRRANQAATRTAGRLA